MNTYFEEQVFEAIDYSEKGLPKGEYEGCIFINCNFSATDLSDIRFVECEFRNCNLSNVKLMKTTLNTVKFKECKMVGVNFEHCDEFLFSIDPEDCLIDLSSFYKRNLKKIRFKNCSLQEVDFIEANLDGSVFDNCNLAGSKFENTILERADFTKAFNYSIDPEINRIKKAKFSLAGIEGLLHKYDIEIR